MGRNKISICFTWRCWWAADGLVLAGLRVISWAGTTWLWCLNAAGISCLPGHMWIIVLHHSSTVPCGRHIFAGRWWWAMSKTKWKPPVLHGSGACWHAGAVLLAGSGGLDWRPSIKAGLACDWLRGWPMGGQHRWWCLHAVEPSQRLGIHLRGWQWDLGPPDKALAGGRGGGRGEREGGRRRALILPDETSHENNSMASGQNGSA